MSSSSAYNSSYTSSPAKIQSPSGSGGDAEGNYHLIVVSSLSPKEEYIEKAGKPQKNNARGPNSELVDGFAPVKTTAMQHPLLSRMRSAAQQLSQKFNLFLLLGIKFFFGVPEFLTRLLLHPNPPPSLACPTLLPGSALDAATVWKKAAADPVVVSGGSSNIKRCVVFLWSTREVAGGVRRPPPMLGWEGRGAPPVSSQVGSKLS